jgi:hypothetical protein
LIDFVVISENRLKGMLSYSRHVIPPTPTVQRFRGPIEKGTALAAKPELWLCWPAAR